MKRRIFLYIFVYFLFLNKALLSTLPSQDNNCPSIKWSEEGYQIFVGGFCYETPQAIVPIDLKPFRRMVGFGQWSLSNK